MNAKLRGGLPPMLETTIAPWTAVEVASLNAYQAAGVMHPFTCDSDDEPCASVLVATTDGWICPDCGYTQNWAHEFMADGTWRQLLPNYDPGPSYSELVNAPLSPAAVGALRKALASKDPATYRKVRINEGEATDG